MIRHQKLTLEGRKVAKLLEEMDKIIPKPLENVIFSGSIDPDVKVKSMVDAIQKEKQEKR